MERAPEFQFQQKIKLQALCKGDSHTLEVRNDPRAPFRPWFPQAVL